MTLNFTMNIIARKLELVMQKRFALFSLALIFIVTLIPAYYPPDDEALRQNSSFYDIYNQLFISTGTYNDFNHNLGWTGLALSWFISYRPLQDIPSFTDSRAPPYSVLSYSQLS